MHAALSVRLRVEILSLVWGLVMLCVLFVLGLHDLFVLLSFSLTGFWPTINTLARRNADGFFVRGVLSVVF